MPQVTRREASRRATYRDILGAGRRLLAAGGPPSVSLRAVASEVGMTAPALYRYFPSHDDLLLALTDQVVGELVEELDAAAAEQPPDDPMARLLAATRAFRGWCLGHQREFQLAFGLAPAPPGDAMPPHCDTDNVRSLCGYFFNLFVELWQTYRFPVDPDHTVPPDLANQLYAFLDVRDVDVPVGLVKTYLDAWVRLYGMVAMEVFGHLRFILHSTDTMFETLLAEFAADLLSGVEPEQPGE